MAKADANVSIKFEGDDDKLVRTLGRLEDRLKAVTTDLRKIKKTGEAAGEGVGKKMKGAGKEAMGAFGPGAVKQMKTFATSVIGIGSAAGGGCLAH